MPQALKPPGGWIKQPSYCTFAELVKKCVSIFAGVSYLSKIRGFANRLQQVPYVKRYIYRNLFVFVVDSLFHISFIVFSSSFSALSINILLWLCEKRRFNTARQFRAPRVRPLLKPRQRGRGSWDELRIYDAAWLDTNYVTYVYF